MSILNFAYKVGFTPMYWDSSRSILRISNSRIRLGWVAVQLLLVLLYEMFLTYQVTRLEDSMDRMRVIYLAVFWTLTNCNYVGYLWAPEYVQLMNRLNDVSRKSALSELHYYEYFVHPQKLNFSNNLNITGDEKNARISQTFTKVITSVGAFATLSVTAQALLGSSSPTLLTSVLVAKGDGKHLWFPWRLPIAFFHYITNGFHIVAFCLQWTSVVSYSVDVSHLLKTVEPAEDGEDADNYRTGLEFARVYRTLGILQKQFGTYYEKFMILTQTAAIFFIVLNTYQAVVGRSVRALVLASAVAYELTKFVEASAQVYHVSTDVLDEWRRVNRSQVPLWFNRFLRSCKFLCVPVGSFFYVDRGLVLTIMSIILDNAANLILAD